MGIIRNVSNRVIPFQIDDPAKENVSENTSVNVASSTPRTLTTVEDNLLLPSIVSASLGCFCVMEWTEYVQTLSLEIRFFQSERFVQKNLKNFSTKITENFVNFFLSTAFPKNCILLL